MSDVLLYGGSSKKLENVMATRASVQGMVEETGCIAYLAQSVYKVVLQKSIPTQIRRLILYYFKYTE